MTDLSTRRLAVAVLLAVFVFALSGCWNPFAPDKGDPKPVEPASYRVRETPEDVLHNLQTAYVWRNAAEYVDCLSEDFEFYPDEKDVQDPQQEIPPVWYKIDEERIHTNMFASGSGVESITLTLTISSLVYDYGIPEDPLDDTCVCLVDVDLRVNLAIGLTYLATAPSQYDMRVDTDQVGPNDELLWEIYAWFDLGDDTRDRTAQEPDTDLVPISFGELKSLFRQ